MSDLAPLHRADENATSVPNNFSTKSPQLLISLSLPIPISRSRSHSTQYPVHIPTSRPRSWSF